MFVSVEYRDRRIARGRRRTTTLHPGRLFMSTRFRQRIAVVTTGLCLSFLFALPAWQGLSNCRRAAEYRVEEDAAQIRIETPQLQAAVCKKGYVSGVQSQSFLDKKTGFRDPGFGLDIVDWIMEPGSDEAYRDQLPANWSTGPATPTTARGETVARRAADLHAGERTAARGDPRRGLRGRAAVVPLPDGGAGQADRLDLDAVAGLPGRATVLRVDGPDRCRQQQRRPCSCGSTCRAT